jgi:opacity protein-like surface antigen
MKMIVSAAAFAVAMGTCASASATIIDVIYKGSVIEGSGPDDLGLFGAVGGSLVGDAFIATFEMDTSKGNNLSTPTENLIEGGIVYGVESPMLSATLEINGKTADVGIGTSGTVQSFLGQPGVTNQQAHLVQGINVMLLNVSDASGASVGNIPFTIDVPFTFTLDTSDAGFGEANFSSSGISTALSLGPTQLIYQYPSPDGAAPEPSTWAMMLIGFVGLGYAGYRKTREPRAA